VNGHQYIPVTLPTNGAAFTASGLAQQDRPEGKTLISSGTFHIIGYFVTKNHSYLYEKNYMCHLPDGLRPAEPGAILQ
jgi:hypothetical protein